MPDGTNIGKAYLQVVPVAKGIQGSLTSVLNGEAGSAGESAGKSIASKIKSTIIASGIGLAIGNIIKQGLDLGGELQQSMGGVASIPFQTHKPHKKGARRRTRRARYADTPYIFLLPYLQAFCRWFCPDTRDRREGNARRRS